MTEKTDRPWLKVVEHRVVKLPPDPPWKELCAEHPELDPRKAERLLARLPKALTEDCTYQHLAEFYHDWEAAHGDPRLTLEVSAEDEGFYVSVLAESYRGAATCVVAALEAEGYHFTKFQLWPADQPPRADAQEPPLFAVEAHLAAPLPEGVTTTEEATRRLLDRLRPAFVLLKRGDFARAQSATAGFTVPEAHGQTAPILTPPQTVE